MPKIAQDRMTKAKRKKKKTLRPVKLNSKVLKKFIKLWKGGRDKDKCPVRKNDRNTEI